MTPVPLPTLQGRQLGAMQVSIAPPLYVYGDPEILEWLRLELLKRESVGMPRRYGASDGPMPNWR